MLTRNERINDLMRGVRGEIARKKKREARDVLVAKKALKAEERAIIREERTRDKDWLLIRRIHEQSRREEERKRTSLEKSRRKAEKARRKAEKTRRKAEKEQKERIRVRKALVRQATVERVKARQRRLQRLLRDIKLKRRK